MVNLPKPAPALGRFGGNLEGSYPANPSPGFSLIHQGLARLAIFSSGKVQVLPETSRKELDECRHRRTRKSCPFGRAQSAHGRPKQREDEKHAKARSRIA